MCVCVCVLFDGNRYVTSNVCPGCHKNISRTLSEYHQYWNTVAGYVLRFFIQIPLLTLNFFLGLALTPVLFLIWLISQCMKRSPIKLMDPPELPAGLEMPSLSKSANALKAVAQEGVDSAKRGAQGGRTRSGSSNASNNNPNLKKVDLSDRNLTNFPDDSTLFVTYSQAFTKDAKETLEQKTKDIRMSLSIRKEKADFMLQRISEVTTALAKQEGLDPDQILNSLMEEAAQEDMKMFSKAMSTPR